MRLISLMAALCISYFAVAGCKGGSGSSGLTGGINSSDNNAGQVTTAEGWQQEEIASISAGGMLLPNVKAVQDDASLIHVAWFSDSTVTDGGYTIEHIVWNPSIQDQVSHSSVIDLDNCRTLGLALIQGEAPVVAYQGGEIREGGSEQQSDVMISIYGSGSWTEYTAGIGFVGRNPVFEDGLAGKQVSLAVDSAGDIHVCYQFFYEGIDAMNFNYPDLLYVGKDGSSPDEEASEEVVEGNVYSENGTASEQNRVGEHACIIIDDGDEPAIVYYADLAPNLADPSQKGLRIARRTGDDLWECQWIETGIEIGGISCSLDNEGNVCVAYYVDSEYTDALGTHGHCLKYARQQGSSWDISIADETVWCGRYCSLAFDALGRPAIAYYAMQNHSGSQTLNDLRFAWKNGSSWQREVVASTGDIGLYNTLFYDEGTAYISTFSSSDDTICLFFR